MTLLAIDWQDGKLRILDQIKLPHETVYIDILGYDDAFNAIRGMKVRGAPAIGDVAVLGLVVEFAKMTDLDLASFLDKAIDMSESMKAARPTAVNLMEGCDQMIAKAEELKGTNTPTSEALQQFVKVAEALLASDLATCKAIGDWGAKFIMQHHVSSQVPNGTSNGTEEGKVQVLTHCNAGALATAGYGTAVGVIRSLHRDGDLNMAFCTETRPYNQGARLTAYELVFDKIPGTLITDSMVSALMQKGSVDVVVVGADRIAANGDTANKIGTYQLAIAAKHHGIPFLVAAPFTTIDLKTIKGADIVIEERAAKELTHVQGVHVAAEGINVWNPAFDVTPADLITGIVTEFGVVKPTKRDDGAVFFDLPTFMKNVQEKA
eukprot:Clim_evm9s235 gene=Clim_evmTU9s235